MKNFDDGKKPKKTNNLIFKVMEVTVIIMMSIVMILMMMVFAKIVGMLLFIVCLIVAVLYVIVLKIAFKFLEIKVKKLDELQNSKSQVLKITEEDIKNFYDFSPLNNCTCEICIEMWKANLLQRLRELTASEETEEILKEIEMINRELLFINNRDKGFFDFFKYLINIREHKLYK